MSSSTSKKTRRRELLNRLWDLGRITSTQTVFLHQAIAQSVGLNATDTKCIDLILSHPEGSMTAGSLSGMTGLTTGAVTGVIDRLERSGFALRERDGSDRRKVLVRALPAVERRITPLFEPMQRAMSAAIAGYGDNELVLLIDFLTRAHKETVAATASLRTRGSREPKRDKRQPN